MSHPLVAAVWEQLGRTDIGNILREIIGDHAAQLAVSQVQNGLVADIEPLVRMVFWIKAIFDLQRSYLQGLTSVRECPPTLLPYLLPSETIYSTLMYLIRIKAELLPMMAAGVRDRAQYRYFLAEAVLAGVRLLLLRGGCIHAEMRSNLERAMKIAWQHPGLANEESYLVNVLLPRAIGDIGCADVSNGQSPLAACGRHSLPSFNSGLYPFPMVPETYITDLLTGLVGNGADHTSSFWTLFDTLWAAESALIQCHVDSRRIPQQQEDTTSSTVEEAFVQTEEARKRLARTILAASDGQADTPALKILANIILSQTADGNPPLQTRKVRDAWNQMAGFRNTLDGSLSHFVRWLINRRVQLWDCNGELEAVSHEYQRHLTQWLHSSSPAESERHSHETDKAGAVYVVDCPFVHPVPKALLKEQLRKNGSDTDELQAIPELLSVNTSCPLCPEGTKIQYARIIEPLEHLSSALHSSSESESILSRRSTFGSVSGCTASRSSSLSHSTRRSSAHVAFSDSKPSSPNGSMPKMKSSQSLYAMANSLNHLSAPWLDKHQQKQTVKSLSKELKGVKLSLPVRRASSIRKGLLREQRLARQTRFCFSSSGKSLFFWDEDSSCISRFDIPVVDGQKPEAFRYDVSGVQCVAAGEQRCAVIALVGQHYELLVFGPSSASAEAHVTIDTPGLSLCSNCMAMSRDDRCIAFILESQVHIYELGKSMQKVPVNNSPRWDQTKTAIERNIQFSVDGNGLVVTRLEGQSVYFDVWHREPEAWDIANDGFYLIKNTSIDGCLTGVSYDSLHRSILLTAFSSKEYPLFFSTSNGKASGSPFSAKIVHSAQSPSGSRYAIANGLNEIYICDYKPDMALSPIRIKKASSKIPSSASKPGRLLLSFLQENILLVFWAKDQKLMLRTFRLNENGEVISDYDLRTDLERLMAERVPTASSRTQSPRLGVSSSPVGEKKAPLVTLRPDLPELDSN